MIRNILIAMFLLFSTQLFAGSQHDKSVSAAYRLGDEKVKTAFDKLMHYYRAQDKQRFFSLVSENGFLQDYMAFSEAIDKDFRTYQILGFDYWIDKITVDGKKRYLYIHWDKRYEVSDSTYELRRSGASRLLFDEIGGKYKLIQFTGDDIWGGSSGN